MPRGSKKRKSAKKKMENQSDNNHSSSASARSVGDKSLQPCNNERESDVGEVTSLASLDHHNHNLLTEVEGDENQEKNEGSRIKEKAVQAEREFKIVSEPDGYNGRLLEHDEMEIGKSESGESSASSGSSSDDEAHCINNGQATEDSSSVFDSVKVVDPSPEKTPEAIHSIHAEEVKIITSVYSEKGSKLDGHLKFTEGNRNSVGDKIDASLEREKGAIDQSMEKISTISAHNALSATTDYESENERDSAVTQPLLLPSPSPVQKSSWRSCCGLFEVFSGSGRIFQKMET